MIASPVYAVLIVISAFSAGTSLATYVGLGEYEKKRGCDLGSRRLHASLLMGLLLLAFGMVSISIPPTILQTIGPLFYPVPVSLVSLAALSRWLLGPVLAGEKDAKWLAKIMITIGLAYFLITLPALLFILP